MSPRDQLIIRALHYFVKTIPAIAWLRSENVPKQAHRAGTSLEVLLPHEEAVSGSVPGGARRSSRRASGICTLARFNSGDLEVHALGCRVTRRPALVVDARRRQVVLRRNCAVRSGRGGSKGFLTSPGFEGRDLTR